MRHQIFQALKTLGSTLNQTIVNNFTTLITEVNNYFSEVQEATGFPDPDSIELSFNDGNRRFTIAPTGDSFVFWAFGTRYEKTSSEYVTIEDVTGQWYVYYDSTGVLHASQTIWNLATEVPVGSVYWSGGSGTVEPQPAPPNTGKLENIYVVAVSIPSTLTASQVVLFHVVVGGETVRLVKNLINSHIKCGTAPTSTASFDILINGVSRGSASISAGQTIGTFTWNTQRDLSGGDILKITAPGVADATLADVGITLRGSRR
jgi:hypothetical protein